jgi:phage replication-related protein YjqB (UPF0714/DUF867 family)
LHRSDLLVASQVFDLLEELLCSRLVLSEEMTLTLHGSDARSSTSQEPG